MCEFSDNIFKMRVLKDFSCGSKFSQACLALDEQIHRKLSGLLQVFVNIPSYKYGGTRNRSKKWSWSKSESLWYIGSVSESVTPFDMNKNSYIGAYELIFSKKRVLTKTEASLWAGY